jgi:hypothetical protein
MARTWLAAVVVGRLPTGCILPNQLMKTEMRKRTRTVWSMMVQMLFYQKVPVTQENLDIYYHRFLRPLAIYPPPYQLPRFLSIQS